jgi:predicted nuclease of predicted toxin-antitoxin system
LKSKGFDITSIGIEYQGTRDEDVMKLAIEQDRTIITYDSDYGELIFKRGFKPNAGVIFIRQQPTEPLETARIIDRLSSNSDLTFERTLTVVDSNSLRQKKY